MSEEEKFELFDKKGEHPSGIMRLYYGSGPADPHPFVLSIMTQYILRELRKTPPITVQIIQDYVNQNAEHLKKIALNAKARGRNAEVLE
jgi:hypothetical protein